MTDHPVTLFTASIAIAALVHALAGMAGSSPAAETAGRRTVEIRSYNLKPGARAGFHRLASEVAVPMLRRWKIDVVALGPSPHDDTSYYLVRSFDSLEHRQSSEDAFYGSEEWRSGPREAILAAIESYTTVVIEMDAATLEGLRQR